MNTSTITTPVPSVRFGATHGYRFVADEVELNATFTIANRSAHDRSWALQLWACPSVPARSDDLVGHLVAEAALPPISEISGETEAFVVNAAAQPPAGDRDHSMVLVLAARRGGGSFDEVHDVTSFPTRERFVLPRLAGPISYQIDGDRVRVSVAAIENPREATNLSGTISVELWALPTPYAGGAFGGSPLAGAVLGTLSGQDRWSDLALDLRYTAPSAGTWQVVVMVREWTGAGYTTRDFATLGTLTIALASMPAPVAAPTSQIKPTIADVSAEKAAPVVATTQPVAAAKPTASAPAPAPEAKPAVPVVADKTAAPARPAKAATPAKVALNTATLEQLLAIKGLPRAVAERIVRDRPFKSVDDVLQVKGMGEKLFAKVCDGLTL